MAELVALGVPRVVLLAPAVVLTEVPVVALVVNLRVVLLVPGMVVPVVL